MEHYQNIPNHSQTPNTSTWQSAQNKRAPIRSMYIFLTLSFLVGIPINYLIISRMATEFDSPYIICDPQYVTFGIYGVYLGLIVFAFFWIVPDLLTLVFAIRVHKQHSKGRKIATPVYLALILSGLLFFVLPIKLSNWESDLIKEHDKKVTPYAFVCGDPTAEYYIEEKYGKKNR